MPIQLSGSLVITGSITTTGVITMSGSIASASYSSTSDLLQGTGSVGFATTASLLEVSSSQQQISASLLTLTASYAALSSSYTALSGSYNTFSGSASTRTTQIEQVYATTGSNSFRANQSITGSLVVSSTITAQTLVVQTVTSSILYSSGSNLFGNALNNTQTFTGSIQASGSSTHFFLGGNVGIGTTNPTFNTNSTSKGLDITNATGFSSLTLHGSGSQEAGICGGGNSQGLFLDVAGDANAANNNISFRNTSINSSSAISTRMFISSSGNIGIGTVTPIAKLHVQGAIYASSQINSDTLNNASNSANIIYRSGSSTIVGNNASALVVLDGGNLGVGTITPTYKFETLGTSVITAAFGRSDYGASNVMLIAMNGYRDVYKQAIGVVRTGDYDKGDIIFCLNASANSTVVSSSDEKMRITSGGNVGIGNTTALHKVQIGANADTKTSIGQSILFLSANAGNIGYVNELGFGDVSSTYPQSAIGNIITNATAASYGDLYFATRAVTTDTAPTERMRINSAGIVTKPYHPVFHVGRGAGNVASATTVVWNVIFTNVGSYYNDSNGRFTAPVAGVYYFAFSVMSDGDVGMDMQLQKNGVVYQGCVPLQSAIGSAYNQITGVCTITLAASDYVSVYNSTGTMYGSNATGRHTMFCGFLVG